MITVMRQYMKALHIFLWLVVGSLVVTTFYVWGKGSLAGVGGESGGVAVVNGESIPVERYRRVYEAYLNRYSQLYPDRFTPEMAERMGLRQQVVNELVTETLIVQQAQAEGLAVTDEELNAQIQAVPAFHENGVFSVRLYQEFLRRRGTTPAAFEADVRRDLTRSKVESAVRAGVKVSDAEIEQAFGYRKEKARAAWALVDLSPLMAKTTASEAEVAAYLKDNPGQFQRPERRRVLFVLIDAKDVTKPITDAEVQKYYGEHRAEFETPREAHVAHVLIRVPETGGSQAEQQARAQAADVIRRAKAGEDFGKLAQQFSADPGTAARGGDVGWIAKGQTVPAFEAAAFALKRGEVSPEPIRTQFGFHAIKVIDIRAGGGKPVKEVAPQIRAKLFTDQLAAAAAARAREVRPALLAAPDFAAEAKRLGLQAHESIVSRPGGRAGMPRPEPMQDAAFANAIGGVSEPLSTPAGLVIMKVMDQLPAGVPPLADIKDEVGSAVKRQKAEAVALERAQALAAAAQRGGDLAALGKQAGDQTGETALFSRGAPADRLPPEAMQAAFATPTGRIGGPVKTPQGYWVVKTLERVAPDPLELAKERAQIARQLLEAKRNDVWQRWVLAARQRAKIELGVRAARG
jgi:peptidyl-prolyl cis-trans isomerase D